MVLTGFLVELIEILCKLFMFAFETRVFAFVSRARLFRECQPMEVVLQASRSDVI